MTMRDVLTTVFEKLIDTNIPCALIGSTSLRLQGMETIEPNDIDILVAKEDMENVKTLFLKYNPSHIHAIKPLRGEPVWELTMRIEDINVQILGEPFAGEAITHLRNKNNIIYVKLGRINIPCRSLATEAAFYEATNRSSKANLIRTYIATGEQPKKFK